MTAFYATFKFLMKLLLRLYFKKIRLEGLANIPKDRPLLVTPNHQNAFLDALIVGAFLPRELHFLTRADVFNKWTIPLMKWLNMMPVYRIRDGYDQLSKNEEVFDGCREIFSRNKSILIFPEGNHGGEYYLRPLTKGAARLALQSQEKMEASLMVLPVGLNYFDHQSANSLVIVQFGEPITVSDYLASFEKHQASGLIKMRDAISSGMKETLILPEETEDYEQRKEALFFEENESLSFDDLKTKQVDSDSKTRNRQKKNHLLARILNPLPFLIIHAIIRRVDDLVFHPSLKFAIALFAFPLWWGIIFIALSFVIGIKIALLAVIVMSFGLIYNYKS